MQQKIGIIAINNTGSSLAEKLRRELGAEIISRDEVGRLWATTDAFIFIGALGICVRSIAPYVKDKHTDPAVVCVDSMGMNAISVLSGHIGGANSLTQAIAEITGSRPVITTQSDNAGLWALDTLDRQFGWNIASDKDDMNNCIFTFVNREPTALLIEARDRGTDHLLQTLPPHVTLISDIRQADAKRFQLLIIISPYLRQAPEAMHVIHYVPMVGTIGFGLAHHPDDYESIFDKMNSMLRDNGVLPCALNYCTIDVKRDEEFVELLQTRYHKQVEFFSAEALSAVEVPTPSVTVEKHVGTPSVCEAAAILGSGHGRLIVPKLKGKTFTIALAISTSHLPAVSPIPEAGKAAVSAENTDISTDIHNTADNAVSEEAGYTKAEICRRPHIEIVGAGPGDPDLISVRGRKYLEEADLILYAGSLVPRELTHCAKPGATIRSSADMDLEEQFSLMKEYYDRGLLVVRLHTGDPCIYGAIQEQMAFFDAHNMSYHITPGISSFLAAAAELRSQFTIPERCQTIILTRGEGRTPTPEREQLRLLAAHRSTMCIFLSASLAEQVQTELLAGGYPPETPVAACYKLTWKEQRICRGQLKDLAAMIRENALTLTTMIVVGDAIDNRAGVSRLYDSKFTHLFRKGKE